VPLTKNDDDVRSAEVKIPPPGNSGFLGGWFGSRKLPTDFFLGQITRVSDGKKLSETHGSWMGAIDFDGKTYWTFKEKPVPHEPVVEKLALPSDSRFRPDIQCMVRGDMQAAAEAKLRLEEKQRRDAKMRKERAGAIRASDGSAGTAE
jgi:hypothetical protein